MVARPPRQMNAARIARTEGRGIARGPAGSDISDVLRVLVDVRRDVQDSLRVAGAREKSSVCGRIMRRCSSLPEPPVAGASLFEPLFVHGIREEHADLVETRFWSYV